MLFLSGAPPTWSIGLGVGLDHTGLGLAAPVGDHDINTGIRKAPIEIVKRLTAGEIVDPSLYYFRTSAVFEVGPGPYEWLTESIFVCVGERRPDLVRMKVYQVG